MNNENNSTQGTIEIAGIQVPVGDGTSAFIPQNSKTFIDSKDIMTAIAIGIRDNYSVLMIGESGTGKSSAIRYIAEKTQRGLRRINLNGGTTADELVGRILINEKGTYWVDGPLTEAVRNGDMVVLDEINAALPEVLFVLHALLDDDGYLVLTEKPDKEIVRKHPNFRFFATCNPPEYAGTKEMNQALLSRFGICIYCNFPEATKETEIIESHLGTNVAKDNFTQKLIELSNNLRNEKANNKINYAVNTRDILNTLRLIEAGMDERKALDHAFTNKLERADATSFENIAKLILPKKKVAAGTTTAINKPENMTIGSTIRVEKDMRDVYYGITTDPREVSKYIKETNFADITTKGKMNASKGDEFAIKASYYEFAGDEAITTEITDPQKLDDAGRRIASLIEFTKGQNKTAHAIIIHTEEFANSNEFQNSTEILKNLVEI